VRARLCLIVAVALLLFPSIALAGKAWNRGGTQPLSTTVEEYCLGPEDLQLLGLINQYRAEHGIHALSPDQRLGAAAQHHSVDIVVNQHFSHTLSDGTTWSQNIVNHGYTSSGRGENIAWGYTSVEAVFAAWRSSPGHNANMLNENYRAIGVAMVPPPDPVAHANNFGWTNTFGSRLEQDAVTCGDPLPTIDPSITPDPTNTPGPTATPQPTRTPKPCKWGSSWKCSGDPPGKGIGTGARD
jgi:hypothetical protein